MPPRKKTSGPFIVGFNGPPRVGKDTLATALQNLLDEFTNVPVHRYALAASMRDGAAAILGMTGGDKWYNEIKDKPLEILNGGTFRQFMIDMSETFVKRLHGRDFWGRRLHHANQAWWNTVPAILIITDVGFADEVEYLAGVSSSFLNVRVDRPGPYDFSNDSRGYVSASHYPNGQDYAYTNDETPSDGARSILKRMYKLGWPVV